MWDQDTIATSLENGHEPQQILPQERSEPATSSQELNITSPTAQCLADHVFELLKGADDSNNLMSFRQDTSKDALFSQFAVI